MPKSVILKPFVEQMPCLCYSFFFLHGIYSSYKLLVFRLVHMTRLPWYSPQWDKFFLRSYGCFHPTSPGKNLFSSHLTVTKLTNKDGAVFFDTGDFTWYYDCCRLSELINIEHTSTILQNTTSGTNKSLNRQNIPILVMRMTRSYGKFSSHFTEILPMHGGISPNRAASFPYEHEIILNIN